MFNHLKGKKLYRSPKDALIFGIAAGLAYYLQVDVVFVRLVLVALAFLTGWWPMFFVYIVGVVLMPIDPAQDTVAAHQEPKDVTPPAEEPKHEEKPSQAEKMDSELNM
jgi:phage shock protein PspC (stress-responsive transcriptional regulator)